MSMLSKTSGRAAPAPGFVEFVCLIALMMGLISLSIDNLLPAFGPIQADFGIADPNALQYLLSVYMVGFGLMQLVYGPLSDMVGRRPVLMIGLAVFCVGSVIAIVADGFALLLVARFIQGMGAAAMRVLTVAIIRDRYQGREMARVMSLTMMVFIIVPVFAPAIGGFFLLLGSWRLIFWSMLGLALIQAVWQGMRLPETLHPDHRFPVSPARIAAGLRQCVLTRATLGYTTAMALMFGCLMSYLVSSQPIFETVVYGLGPWFPAAFGAIAAVMSVASFTSAGLVRRLGMRRLSHAGLCGFTAMSGLLLIVGLAYDGRPPLLLFGAIMAGAMFLFSLTMPSFGTMAMEPLGAIAGTASSFIGFTTTIAGAALGALVGQAFDGTVVPLSVGFFGLSLLCVVVALWTERWRLFVPHHPDPPR